MNDLQVIDPLAVALLVNVRLRAVTLRSDFVDRALQSLELIQDNCLTRECVELVRCNQRMNYEMHTEKLREFPDVELSA